MFRAIKDRVWKKISGWEGKLISKVGKEVLIQAVCQAMPTYSMSVFRLPAGFCSEIDNILACYWWSKGLEDALLTKKGWRLLEFSNSLIARMLVYNYEWILDYFGISNSDGLFVYVLVFLFRISTVMEASREARSSTKNGTFLLASLPQCSPYSLSASSTENSPRYYLLSFLSSGLCGVVVAVRDSYSRLCGAIAMHAPSLLSILATELCALKIGISFAVDASLTPLIIESNSSTASHLIFQDDPCYVA
ncbi:hypothetical protein ACE6H2_027076 [Prunus campanulata]